VWWERRVDAVLNAAYDIALALGIPARLHRYTAGQDCFVHFNQTREKVGFFPEGENGSFRLVRADGIQEDLGPCPLVVALFAANRLRPRRPKSLADFLRRPA